VSWWYRHVARPVLFNFDSEEIHNRTLESLGSLSRSPLALECLRSFLVPPALPISLWGLKFPNPVGLAAGMDKQGQALPAWAAMGFGFSELGGVTWQAQPGNPQPRMFRAIPDRALVNRMGFNNGGAEALAERLGYWRASGLWPKHPVGINLGKSKVTPLEEAAGDYANSFQALRDSADFFVVNVSSPNTPNLRQLQDKQWLDEILAALQELNREAKKPILVKVAPDLSFEALDEILELVWPRSLAGIVATNTTLARPDTALSAYAEAGGLSGAPLRARSTEVIRHLFVQSSGRTPIIGVGGIFSAEDAWEKITAGATLLQLYTSLVYEGPGVAGRIVRGLAEKLHEHRLGSIADAVGIYAASGSAAAV
jgi:dihydroorotate dehydrogenase